MSHLIVLFGLGLQLAQAAPAASPTDLSGGMELLKQGQYEAANSLFGRLTQAEPANGEAWFEYGYSFTLEAAAESDPAAARVMRQHSFAAYERAKAVGCANVLLPEGLAEVNAAGDDLRSDYSPNPQASEQIKQGEQLYTQHRMDEAREAYQKALEFDPKNYSAALFTGDSYFGQKNYADAIAWFTKAVAFDPNRETAHRYWADALIQTGEPSAAGLHYIEAVVGEPYSRYARLALDRYAQQSKAPLMHPPVRLPRLNVSIKGDKTEVDYDLKSGPLVIAYALGRSQWLTKERTHYFPAQAGPRHSLPEECAGLRTFLSVAQASAIKNPESTHSFDETIATLKDLDHRGLLEAFVLLDRADAGIAKDYPAYRLQHRDQIERYIHEVWFQGSL